MLTSITDIVEKVKKDNPLIHCITNYVTINDCANILLSFGASPAMCEAKEEVKNFVTLAKALYLNIGTLTEIQKEAMQIAAKKASEKNIPIIIDPVGAAAIQSRKNFVIELLTENNIAVLKGNVGEIKALGGFETDVKGVDSLDSGIDAAKACKTLAKKYNTVVAATGKTDVITDGDSTCFIKNGHEMLKLVTGVGCMIGALAAATAAVEKDYLPAAAAAVGVMGIVGEISASEMNGSPLPGTYRTKLIDNIHKINKEYIEKEGKFKWE